MSNDAEVKEYKDWREAIRPGTWVLIADQVEEDSVGDAGRSQKAVGQGVNERQEVVTAGRLFHPETQLGREGESLEDEPRRKVQ